MLGQMTESTRWWSVRRAQNRKPATYRCPLCRKYLPALSEHMLITPEGDTSRRRHAHTGCVLKARKEGRLPTREEWLRSEGARQGTLAQAVAWMRERWGRS
jgi:hypothetical protein